MATANPVFSHHGTTSGTAADTINLSGAVTVVEVYNRSGAAPLWFSVNGAAVSAAAQDDTYYVPAVANALLRVAVTDERNSGPSVVLGGSYPTVVVSIYSATTATDYSVVGYR